jgi:hypothetical protein
MDVLTLLPTNSRTNAVRADELQTWYVGRKMNKLHCLSFTQYYSFDTELVSCTTSNWTVCVAAGLDFLNAKHVINSHPSLQVSSVIYSARFYSLVTHLLCLALVRLLPYRNR